MLPRLPFAAQLLADCPTAVDVAQRPEREWFCGTKDEIVVVTEVDQVRSLATVYRFYDDSTLRETGLIQIQNFLPGDKCLHDPVLHGAVLASGNVNVSRVAFRTHLEEPFTALLITLMDTIYRISAFSEHIPHPRLAILKDQIESSALANNIVEGMPLALLSACTKEKQMSHETLLALPRCESAMGGGIYVIVYRQQYLPVSLYVGSTNNFLQRRESHWFDIRHALPNGKSHHSIARQYFSPDQLQRTDNPLDMFILTGLPDDMPPSAVSRYLVAEQLFTLLLNSYSSALFALGHKQDGMQDDGLQITGRFKNAVLSKQAYDAIALTNIANKVLEHTSWKTVTVQERTFRGLNWNSACTEHNPDEGSSPFSVIKTPMPGLDAYCFESNFVVRPAFGGQPLLSLPGPFSGIGPTELLELLIPSNWGIKVGEHVRVIVELAKPGMEHQYQFCCVPNIGAWSNWDELKRIGIALEWNHLESRVMRGYLQEYVLQSNFMQACFKLIAALELRQFPQTRPEHMIKVIPVYPSVRELAFDPLTHHVTMTSMGLRSEEPWPREITVDENRERMRQAGIENFGPMPAEQRRTIRGSDRQSCDLCSLLRRRFAKRMNCKGGPSCAASCKPLNRLCTWTHSPEIDRDGVLDDAVFGVPRAVQPSALVASLPVEG